MMKTQENKPKPASSDKIPLEALVRRTIKFRAWDKECEIMTSSPINKINFKGQIHLHKGWKDVENTCYVLMQFTGLKDKNGKEIYEGDIIKTPMNHVCHIKWGTVSIVKSNDRFEYTGFAANYRGHNYHFDRDIAKGEIIGNIFDNPELLEKVEYA